MTLTNAQLDNAIINIIGHMNENPNEMLIFVVEDFVAAKKETNNDTRQEIISDALETLKDSGAAVEGLPASEEFRMQMWQ